MILVFALAGIFTATLAATATLVMGQPWWIGLVSYIGTGMVTAFVLAVFVSFGLKTSARKSDTVPLGAHLPLADLSLPLTP